MGTELGDTSRDSILDLRYTIICYNEGKIIFKRNTRKRGSVQYHAKDKDWDSVYLKVRYLRDNDDVYNEGKYQYFAEFEKAFQAFTEPELIDYLLEAS